MPIEVHLISHETCYWSSTIWFFPPSHRGRQGHACVLSPFSCTLPRQKQDVKNREVCYATRVI
jgi:hypothetical protein